MGSVWLFFCPLFVTFPIDELAHGIYSDLKGNKMKYFLIMILLFINIIPATLTAAEHTKPDTSWSEVVESIKTTSSKTWAAAKSSSEGAWSATKKGSSKAWKAAKKGSSEVWVATKEVSSKAWNATKEAVSN